MTSASPSRRAFLAGGAAATVPVAAQEQSLAPHPDAELIRLCEEHRIARDTFNARCCDPECDEDTLFVPYGRVLGLLDQATPRTIEGILAKARAAKIEALNAHGEEAVDFSSTASQWAWDIVNDLLRLASRSPA